MISKYTRSKIRTLLKDAILLSSIKSSYHFYLANLQGIVTALLLEDKITVSTYKRYMNLFSDSRFIISLR